MGEQYAILIFHADGHTYTVLTNTPEIPEGLVRPGQFALLIPILAFQAQHNHGYPPQTNLFRS